MNLTKEEIKEFKEIYEKEYKVVLSIEEAETTSKSLIELLKPLFLDDP